MNKNGSPLKCFRCGGSVKMHRYPKKKLRPFACGGYIKADWSA